MKSSILAAAAIIAFVGVAASAQEAQNAQQPQEEKKICRTERATGSLTRRTRICLTAAQWRELNDRTRKGLNEMASGASGGKACAQDPSGGC